MPKRSNPFQHLVYLIERIVNPFGVKVTQSKELPERRTGDLREVDIVIESKTGVHEFVIGVECLSERRPATKEWVEQMSGKHEDLPTHKLILVSRSGFARSAADKARSLGIDTLSLKQAERADWSAIAGKATDAEVASFDFPQPLAARVHIASSEPFPSGQEIPDDVVLASQLHDPAGALQGTVRDVMEEVLHRPEGIRLLDRQIPDGQEKGPFRFLIGFNEGSYVIDHEGKKRFIKAIEVWGEARKQIAWVPLRSGSYREAVIAHGEGECFGRPFQVAIVEQPGNDVAMTVSTLPVNPKRKRRRRKQR